MESRQPPLGVKSRRRYSAAQIYLIRQRLRAYKEMKSAQEGPSFNWKSVAEILHILIEEIEGIRETELRIIRVEIIISRDGNLVHVNETADIFTDPGVKDPEDWSPGQRKHYFDRQTKNRGWGILTPEDNLLCFLKREVATNTYQGNKYYSTIASIPKLGARVPIEHLALLTYDGSYGQDDEGEDRRQWRQEISQKILSNNLRYFIRIPEDRPSIMGS
jgi:hypothetical protein